MPAQDLTGYTNRRAIRALTSQSDGLDGFTASGIWTIYRDHVTDPNILQVFLIGRGIIRQRQIPVCHRFAVGKLLERPVIDQVNCAFRQGPDEQDHGRQDRLEKNLLIEQPAHCRSHFVYPTQQQAYEKQDDTDEHSYSKCFSSRIHVWSPYD
jgi:hypothetical protein